MDTESKQTTCMHGTGIVMQADTVPGLAVSADGFTLALGLRTATPGGRFQLTFRILDERGRTVRDFDVKHTKRLHLVVVRRDMIDFQHLHPIQVADGSWATPLTLHEAGSYRVFADFSTGGRPYVLADDLLADGTVAWQALPVPACATEADGFEIRLTEGTARAGGRGVPARVRRHAQRQARRAAELPRRQGTPGRSAAGRPRLPARAPRHRELEVHGDVPHG